MPVPAHWYVVPSFLERMRVAEFDTQAPAVIGDAEFVSAWRDRLVYRGFRQVWVNPFSGVPVDFSRIADPSELRAESDRAEAQYLEYIELARRSFCDARGRRNLQQSEEDFERGLWKDDLYYLSKFVLGYDKEVFHLHYFMAETMVGLPPGYRGLREFPRDSFKTTVMGVSFLVQQVLRDPEVRILYKSNAEGNAVNKCGEARAHFIDNAGIRALFPEFVPKTKAEEGRDGKWDCPARTTPQREGTFNAAGVGSSKTSQHYGIIVGDDFWDEKSVTSPDKSLTTARELDGLEYLLATPAQGKIVLIGTRFAHDDPTTTIERNPEYQCVIVSGVLPCGRSLFPESLTLDKMKAQSASTYTFSCQIILNPTTADQSLAGFGHLSWKSMQALEAVGLLRVRKVIVTDAAGSKSKTSDEAALMTVAIDHLGRCAVVGSRCGKLSPSEFVDALFAEFDAWLPDMVVVQKAAIDTVVMSFIEERDAKRVAEGKRPLPVYRYSLGNEEKKRRITSALQPLLNAGKLYLDPSLPDAPMLEKEGRDHPNTQDDHRLDALAALGDSPVRMPPPAPVVPVPVERAEPVRAESAREMWREVRRELASQYASRASVEAPEDEEADWVGAGDMVA